jgi:hypothetical protein
MSPISTTRYLMLAAAQRIPPEKRVRWATKADAHAAMLNF